MDKKLKIKMYVLSLWLLFCFVVIATLDVEVIRCFLVSDEVLFIDVLRKNIISCVCIFFLFICIVFYLQLKFMQLGTTMHAVKVEKISNRNTDALAFLATYVVPLVFTDLTSTRYILIMLLLLITIGIIYVKTDMFLINPTLLILGYRVYSIETDLPSVNGVMISMVDVKEGDSIKYLSLGEKAYFIKR